MKKQAHAQDYARTRRNAGRAPFQPARDWDNGDSCVVQGDAIHVMRTMPGNFFQVVYLDPTFNTQRVYNKGMPTELSDIRKWDHAAEAMLKSLGNLHEPLVQEGSEPVADIIALIRKMNPGMTSCLVGSRCRQRMPDGRWDRRFWNCSDAQPDEVA